MKRHTLVLVLAFAYQANAQVLVDNQDPRAPRPSAAFPSSLDYYGITRPNMDPSGLSYRPSSAGAMLMEPVGTARPTLAFEPSGYASGYGGFYGAPYDFYYPRPPVYVSNVGGSNVFPETATTFFGRVPVSAIPNPGFVVPVSTVSAAPTGYSVAPSSSINYPVASSATVTYPTPFNPAIPSASSASAFHNVASNVPGGSSIFPSSSSLSFGNGGLAPGVSGLQNLPNLQNLPIGSGNLPMGSNSLPHNSGNGVFGSSSSSVIPNGNFVAQV